MLTKECVSVINDGDSVINSFQQMLKFQYIHANGLQEPVLGQGLNFTLCSNVLFVRILHDRNLHWVAISIYGCNPGEDFLTDSLFNGCIADHTKRQICSIVNYEQDILKILLYHSFLMFYRIINHQLTPNLTLRK